MIRLSIKVMTKAGHAHFKVPTVASMTLKGSLAIFHVKQQDEDKDKATSTRWPALGIVLTTREPLRCFHNIIILE